MGRRRAAVVLMTLALVATACNQPEPKASKGRAADRPKGPQTYAVDIDVPSPEGQNLQVSAFLPSRVRVRPGDTVVFENRSTQAPHTVTFGVRPYAPEAPFPATKAGLANPLVFRPCYTDPIPPAGSEACPTPPSASPLPAPLPPYAGVGYWNSGILVPTVVPPGPARSVTLTVAPDTKPGSYVYGCLLHKNMVAGLEVVSKDELRALPAEVAQRAEQERSRTLASAAGLSEPAPASGSATVATGWGDFVAAVNRFAPAVTRIKAGETVTWKSNSRYEPHTVTFVSPFKTPEDPGVFTPGGVKAGSTYTGGFAHSGLIGPEPFPADSFSLVFTKPGTYSYVCVLHPGMAGQVEVT